MNEPFFRAAFIASLALAAVSLYIIASVLVYEAEEARRVRRDYEAFARDIKPDCETRRERDGA